MRRAALVAVVLATAAAGCGGSHRAVATSACATGVDRGEIPSWARTGFSDPRPKMPHVLGRGGRIVAILFGDPLVAPPARDRSNKILWVARRTPQVYAPLRIRATDGARTVTRTVAGGPGPSIVDLPRGCWHLDLRWAGGAHDRLDLRYR